MKNIFCLFTATLTFIWNSFSQSGECANAITLMVNNECVYENGHTVINTPAGASCTGNPDDEVWYKFTAVNSIQTVFVKPSSMLDLVVQVYSGTCTTLNSISCHDETFSGQEEQFDLIGLVPGQEYFLRIFDYGQGSFGDFQICIKGSTSSAAVNDEPCAAIQLPAVTTDCHYLNFTTSGATASIGAPTPISCSGGSFPQQGGFSTGTRDVWFKITVPSSGNIHITPQPNLESGSITDGVMALYTGTCSSLSQIACSDDHSAYPGSGNDLLPLISSYGLTPGSTVYLRYFGFGTTSGTFGLCVTTAMNDRCENALYICDLNGYSASTNGAYTPDRPDNMRGDNEDITGVNMTDGINTGGIFGQEGPWGIGSPFFDVTINNNSWIKFTAAAETATLNVSIFDCWVGEYPLGGLQMQVFEGTNCTGFTPVSDFKESSTGFSITSHNLTVGNEYYLMVDGYAGDICNYTITAESGIQFPNISEVPPICQGDSIVLTAPDGASDYHWLINNSHEQSITIYADTTQTYFCEVSGLCGYRQTLDVTVQVNPNPTLDVSEGIVSEICVGQSITLHATGATEIIWPTGVQSQSITLHPLSDTTFSITGIQYGCSVDTTLTVMVHQLPELQNQPIISPSDCGASTGSISGIDENYLYSWLDESGTIISSDNVLRNIPAGMYSLEIIDNNGCKNIQGPFEVINPNNPQTPLITVQDASPCINSSIQLIATNENSNTVFTWSAPNDFVDLGDTIEIYNIQSYQSGNYCVTASLSGCTSLPACQTISVITPDAAQVTVDGNDSTICMGNSINLSVSGIENCLWTVPRNITIGGQQINITNAIETFEGIYSVTGTSLDGCSVSDSIYISINDLPGLSVSVAPNSNTQCLHSNIELFCSGASSYTWNGPDNFNSTDQHPVIYNVETINQGWYYVSGIDEEQCQNSDSIYIAVINPLPINCSVSDSIVCPGASVIISTSTGFSYAWFGPLNFSSNSQLVNIDQLLPENSGWYYSFVADSNGCIGKDSVFIAAVIEPDCLTIPDLMTPNSDLLNDEWMIHGLEYFNKAEVEIYNRWGNLIFRESPYQNNWSGYINQGATIDNAHGKVPIGTYYFTLKLNDSDNSIFNGFIDVQY